MHTVPDLRVAALHDAAPRADGDYVLYWMIAHRRATWNFALQRAARWAHELRKPLVVLEALRCDYNWASDRLHAFVVQGMAENARRFATAKVLYHPYVEPERGAGRGLLAALSERACVIVTDEFPGFFLPQMVRAAAKQLEPMRFEQVDANGLLPLRAAAQTFPTAHAFRRFVQKSLRPHLVEFPAANPLAGAPLPQLEALPAAILTRWPAAVISELLGPGGLAHLPIDHTVGPGIAPGGSAAAENALAAFIDSRLDRYHEDRNAPELEGASGLSPWLHFGHISAHRVFDAVARHETWMPDHLSDRTSGQREGWWRMRQPAEEFLDQLVTWRELGYNFCFHRPDDYDRFESLPDWARGTLAAHAGDARPLLYTPDAFETAQTHDPLWNAAQMQLVREGRMHNYLRMLWGKKILEWSPSPEEALATILHLNNKYAVDGRNPNSYSGIFWCLGRFDRPWAPQRPIFGAVRWMSSDNTARKFRVRNYIAKYAGSAPRLI